MQNNGNSYSVERILICSFVLQINYSFNCIIINYSYKLLDYRNNVNLTLIRKSEMP